MKVLQWEIYLVNLDSVIGSEQGKTRPVLIISEDSINQNLPIVNILPITSKKSSRFIYPNEALLEEADSGLDNLSIILSHQIRTIDKKRLIKKIGYISNAKLRREIFESLLFQLGYYK